MTATRPEESVQVFHEYLTGLQMLGDKFVNVCKGVSKMSQMFAGVLIFLAEAQCLAAKILSMLKKKSCGTKFISKAGTSILKHLSFCNFQRDSAL